MKVRIQKDAEKTLMLRNYSRALPFPYFTNTLQIIREENWTFGSQSLFSTGYNLKQLVITSRLQQYGASG